MRISTDDIKMFEKFQDVAMKCAEAIPDKKQGFIIALVKNNEHGDTIEGVFRGTDETLAKILANELLLRYDGDERKMQAFFNVLSSFLSHYDNCRKNGAKA